MSNVVGYFDTAEDTPAFDPGLDVACIVCSKPLSRPMVTISVLEIGGMRSLFFRAHKACWAALDEDEQGRYEVSVLGGAQ